jgi:hypothetical protein
VFVQLVRRLVGVIDSEAVWIVVEMFEKADVCCSGSCSCELVLLDADISTFVVSPAPFIRLPSPPPHSHDSGFQ